MPKLVFPFPVVKPGQIVTRMLAGRVPMKLKVTSIDEDFVYCGPPGVGWKFELKTGAEVDEDLNWGPPPQYTGSFLTEIEDADKAPPQSSKLNPEGPGL